LDLRWTDVPDGYVVPPWLHPVIPCTLTGCLGSGLEPSRAHQPALCDLTNSDPAS
jgi:hypothetical protein